MMGRKRTWQFNRLIQSERGGSLPGVLVAVAVGAVLMGLFLSHVSTRMLSLGVVEEKLEEQYAADSAAEFATWTLLNDTTFQDTVDAAYPNPVNITPSITVNSFTPSISAAAVYQRGWSPRASVPDRINQGGDLTFGNGSLFALEWQGNDMHIWRYNPSGDTWTTLTTGPARTGINEGAGIVYGGAGKIYAILDNQSDEFWEYTIGGSWEQKADLPGRASIGSDMVFALGYIYVLQGGRGQGNDGFWRYSLANDSWSVRSPTPENVGEGGALAYAGSNYIYAMAGNGTTDFMRYDLNANSWSNLAPTPAAVEDGGSLSFTGDNTLHALQGGGSTALWSYSINTDGWQVLDSAPAGIGGAGSITWDNGDFLYVLRGNNTTDFWRFLAAPPKYDLAAQAGATTLQSRIQLNRPQAEILWWDWQ